MTDDLDYLRSEAERLRGSRLSLGTSLPSSTRGGAMNTCPCKPCTRIREINAQIDARIETDRATDRCDCGEDTITGCGSRPDRCCGLNADEDTVTITISREDAERVMRGLPEASADFLFGRLALACRAALEGEK